MKTLKLNSRKLKSLKKDQDFHSKRVLKVCNLWDIDFPKIKSKELGEHNMEL